MNPLIQHAALNENSLKLSELKQAIDKINIQPQASSLDENTKQLKSLLESNKALLDSLIDAICKNTIAIWKFNDVVLKSFMYVRLIIGILLLISGGLAWIIVRH